MERRCIWHSDCKRGIETKDRRAPCNTTAVTSPTNGCPRRLSASSAACAQLGGGRPGQRCLCPASEGRQRGHAEGKSVFFETLHAGRVGEDRARAPPEGRWRRQFHGRPPDRPAHPQRPAFRRQGNLTSGDFLTVRQTLCTSAAPPPTRKASANPKRSVRSSATPAPPSASEARHAKAAAGIRRPLRFPFPPMTRCIVRLARPKDLR